MKGRTRFLSIACQIVGRVCACATIEHTTTREAATGGDTAKSQTPIAVIPVPNPTSPETKPPASAPQTITTNCSVPMRCGGSRTPAGQRLPEGSAAAPLVRSRRGRVAGSTARRSVAWDAPGEPARRPPSTAARIAAAIRTGSCDLAIAVSIITASHPIPSPGRRPTPCDAGIEHDRTGLRVQISSIARGLRSPCQSRSATPAA